MILLILPLKSEGQNLGYYPMKFSFRNSEGQIRDTMMSRLLIGIWSKSNSFPNYLQWKDLPFSVRVSSIDGVGLFTDTLNAYNSGDTIGYAFFKRASTGKFSLDYFHSSLGTFINDSEDPNMDVMITSKGILIRANRFIASNTELTINYRAVIALFPNDPTVSKLIYW